MNIKKYDTMLDNRIAIAAISNTQYLAGLKEIYRQDLFEGQMLKTVLGWCISYYDQHSEAPQSSIQDIFGAEYRKLPPELSEEIGDFLGNLSEESFTEKINVEYLLDQTQKKVQQEQLRIFNEELSESLESNDLETAEMLMGEFRRIELPMSGVINPFTDQAAIEHAFDHQPKPLYTMPGKYGDFVNNLLTRDSLVGVLGRDKIGKTWFLMEFAMRAIRQGRSVIFFAAGDLTQPQQTLRFNIRLAGKSNKAKYCGEVNLPVLDCWHNQVGDCDHCDNEPVVEEGDYNEPVYTPFDEVYGYTPCTKCKKSEPRKFKGATWWETKTIHPLTKGEALKHGKRFMKATKGRFRLSCHPNRTLTVTKIESELHRLEVEQGFVPDVIIIDYADIMGPESPKLDRRHQEDERWARLRRLSQVQRANVITATQANRDAYTRNLLTMNNFSESKSKLAHVTGMIGLNQTASEKRRNIIRVNNIVVREDDYDAGDTVSIVQSLTTGRPLITSY